MQCAPQLDGLGDNDDDDIGGGKVDLDDQLEPFHRTGVLEAGGGRRVGVEAGQSRIDQLNAFDLLNHRFLVVDKASLVSFLDGSCFEAPAAKEAK